MYCVKRLFYPSVVPIRNIVCSPVACCDKVVAVLREADGLDLARDFVGGHLDALAPVPNVDNHVVLRTNGYHVFVVGCESLKHEE